MDRLQRAEIVRNPQKAIKVHFIIKADISDPGYRISHSDCLFLIGSCFTSNVGKELENLKFSVLHNPTGILFDPFSVSDHIKDAVMLKQYTQEDLILQDEIWHSFNHHTDFSSVSRDEALEKINLAVIKSGEMIRKAGVLFITLGSAYYYRTSQTGDRVANCHRFPASTFTKHLAEISEITEELKGAIEAVRTLNPGIRVVFTVSPVRHIREGVVNNNRSKARLLESVHYLCDKMPNLYYFPAYELVIDVLRDYRFYDVDMVHPNYSATSYVFEKFQEVFFSHETKEICKEIREVMTAFRHRPNFPDTKAHRRFLASQSEKIESLQKRLPQTDWTREQSYFQGR